jgi:predicted metalloprotease
MLGGGIGTIIVVVVAMYLGVDPRMLLQLGSSVTAPSEEVREARPPGEDAQADFVSVVLADTEDVWRAQFSRAGKTYREPKLVLFTDAVESACGFAQAAVGPFYCPGDDKVYLDLAFFEELKSRFRAPGDFAQAYVIAHEVGHHVQNLLGIDDRVNQARARLDKTGQNRLSVQLELQADCLAGVWAHDAERSRKILEDGDAEEALNAASSIGDDRIQRETTGRVVPDAFTHGTSAQRVRWFRRGFETGDTGQCDAFAAADL